MSDILSFDDISFKSRLLVGTGKFSSIKTMISSIKASKTELVTVALKRFNKAKTEDDLYGPLLELDNITLMPNTSGAMNAKEAIRCSSW